MRILIFTIFCSILFAIGFTLCFVRSLTKQHGRSPEQLSLMPLEDDKTKL